MQEEQEEKVSLLSGHSSRQQTRGQGRISACDSHHHPIFPSYRLLVCMIAFLGNCCSFGSQTLVGASLLLMVRHDHDDVTVNFTTPSPSTNSCTTVSKCEGANREWRFDWDKTAAGWLASSYFVGYYVMQVPTSCLIRRCGGYRLILASGSVTVLCQALSVWVPSFGPCPFAALLFVSGMANACASPSIFVVTAKWTPPSESSRLMSLVLSGNSLGNVLIYCVSAGTSRVNLIGGWPFTFITMVILQILFLLLWRVFVTDSPEDNTFITHSEATYVAEIRLLQNVTDIKKSKRTPWRKILTSPPVYGVAASLYGADWLVYAIITVFPAYFTEVRGMSASMVSMLSGLPWLLVPVTAYLVSQGVDMLRARQCLSTSTLRKIADLIAKPLAGLLLLLSSLVPEGYTIISAVLYAAATLAVLSFQGSSWAANFAELSPDHTDVIIMVAQLFSLTGPFIAPPLFAALTPHKSAVEWQICFAITLGVSVVTSLIYVILGSSRQQNWEDDSSNNTL